MFQVFHFSCLIAMDSGIHDIIIMELCKFFTCLGHGYDHLVQVECPLWIDLTFTFTTRLICRCICPPMQIFASMLLYQAHVWFAPRQDISSRFKNDTVVPGSAYPVVLGILSCCQLSMHFCHLSGMSLALSLWQSLTSACWYSVYDQLSPIYTYANARLKRPPDGTIASVIVLSTMIIVQSFMIIHGVCFIIHFCYRRAREESPEASAGCTCKSAKDRSELSQITWTAYAKYALKILVMPIVSTLIVNWGGVLGDTTSWSWSEYYCVLLCINLLSIIDLCILLQKYYHERMLHTPPTFPTHRKKLQSMTYLSVLRHTFTNHFCDFVTSIMSHASTLVRGPKRRPTESFCLATIRLPGILLEAFAAQNAEDTVSFDTDSKTIVLDNSATCHICNDESAFVSKITPIGDLPHLNVNTAGGIVRPQGFGTVEWSWNDD